jgi:hypothetical protein
MTSPTLGAAFTLALAAAGGVLLLVPGFVTDVFVAKYGAGGELRVRCRKCAG